MFFFYRNGALASKLRVQEIRKSVKPCRSKVEPGRVKAQLYLFLRVQGSESAGKSRQGVVDESFIQ
jgi:hypothetical protein